VKLVHDDDFSVCEHDTSCPRGRHACCLECHIPEFHSEPCVHLQEFANGLDFDC
jgi:hypothetical protein